jgi:hypothetical protein
VDEGVVKDLAMIARNAIDRIIEIEKRKWVGLTKEEKKALYEQADNEDWTDQRLLEAVEAKLKELNK